MHAFHAFTLLVLFFGSFAEPKSVRIVETKSGPIRGQSATTLVLENDYFAFKGIPYAEPPVKSLRFKAPVAKRPWTDTLDTLEFGSKCLQKPTLFGGELMGTEDCLFLNVYTPSDMDENEKLPVMVFIHGGRFLEGSGNDDFFGPDFLIDENVVVVTLNYRLGVFGFLSLGTDEYSGNMGLKDQLLALKWVKENIDSFGGDHEQITIFGHSAGAASVHMHVLSPASQGLFKRALMMSGTALNVWSVCELNEHVLSIFALAKVIEDPVYNLKDLVKFLQRIPVDKVMENQDRIPHMLGEEGANVKLFWAPVIEAANAIDPFMLDTVDEMLSKNLSSVDTMFGFNSMEWIFQMGGVAKSDEFLKHLEEHFEPEIPHPNLNKKHENYQQMTEDIRAQYFGKSGKISKTTINELGHLLSDVVFVYQIDRAVKLHAEKSSGGKTFYYRFAADTNLNAYKILYRASDFAGASHGDEICYLFRCNLNPKLYESVTIDSVEMKTAKRMAKVWANFAKFGNPTAEGMPNKVALKPVLKGEINYLNIANDGLTVGKNPNGASMLFWKSLIAKYDEPERRQAEGRTDRVEL